MEARSGGGSSCGRNSFGSVGFRRSPIKSNEIGSDKIGLRSLLASYSVWRNRTPTAAGVLFRPISGRTEVVSSSQSQMEAANHLLLRHQQHKEGKKKKKKNRKFAAHSCCRRRCCRCCQCRWLLRGQQPSCDCSTLPPVGVGFCWIWRNPTTNPNKWTAPTDFRLPIPSNSDWLQSKLGRAIGVVVMFTLGFHDSRIWDLSSSNGLKMWWFSWRRGMTGSS